MNIFKFFKKSKPEPKPKETILQKDIPQWINNKEIELSKIEDEILKTIKERIIQLTSEIETSVLEFDTIDIEAKTPNARAKAMAKENLKNYKLYLKQMTDKLQKINKIENIIEDINSIIIDFERKSNITYQKIIALVGKDVKTAKNNIRVFLLDLSGVLKLNNKSLEELKVVRKIKDNSKRLEEVKSETTKAETQVESEMKKINQLSEELKNQKNKLLEFKQSEKYLENKKKEQELNSKKQTIEKQKELLNSKIDFKSLSNFYHKFEKEMPIVKTYREDFNQGLKQFGLDKLSNLLDESKLNTEEIRNLIKSIREKQKEVSESKIECKTVDSYENEIKTTESLIQDNETEKSVKEKILENLTEEIKQLKNTIKSELNKLEIIIE